MSLHFHASSSRFLSGLVSVGLLAGLIATAPVVFAPTPAVAGTITVTTPAWSTATRLADPGLSPTVQSYAPVVRESSDGSISMALWRVQDNAGLSQVQAAVATNGQWAPTTAVANAPGIQSSPRAPGLALTPDGSKAVAAWVDGADSVVASFWNGTTWSTPVTVSAAQGQGDVIATISDDGSHALVAWQEQFSGSYVVRTSVWNGIAWGTPVDVSGTDAPSFDAQIALTGNGQAAIAVWRHRFATTNGDSFGIQASSWNGTAWTAPAYISTHDTNPVNLPPVVSGAPTLDMAPDGSFAVAAWRLDPSSAGSWSAIESASWDGTAWTTLPSTGDALQVNELPSVAVSSAGHRALMVWRNNPLGGTFARRLLASTLTGSTWSMGVEFSGTTSTDWRPALAASDDLSTATATYASGGVPKASFYSGGSWQTTALDTATASLVDARSAVTSSSGMKSTAVWLEANGSQPVAKAAFMNATTQIVHVPDLDPATIAVGTCPVVEVKQNQCGDPINTATGEYWEKATDFMLAGRAPLEWSRAYSTVNATRNGALGYGWSGTLLTRLIVPANGTDPAKVALGSGGTLTFTQNPDGTFTAPPFVHATIKHETNGTWTYVENKTLTTTFTTDGLPTSTLNLNGDGINYTYNASKQLTTAATTDGRSLTFAYDGTGRILNVTGPLTRVARYTYNTAGELATATDTRGKVWSYTYDGSHRLTKVTRPDASTVVTTYDAKGRAATQQEPIGQPWTFAYTDSVDASGNTTTVTRVTNQIGAVSEFTYLNGGWLTKAVTDPAGANEATTTYTYNTDGRLTSRNDPLGASWTFTYDGNGNRASETDPAGNTTTYTYNSFNQPLTITNAAGDSRTFAYDARGNVTSGTDFAGNTTTYTYGDAAHTADVTRVTNPAGAATNLTYTAEGFPASSTGPLGAKTTWTYNPYGAMLTTVTPRGNATGATPATYTTTVAYEIGSDLPTKVTTPNSRARQYAYDSVGNLAQYTTPNVKIWKYTYDGDHNPLTVTDPLTGVTRYEYNGNGAVTKVTRPDGAITTIGYDAIGRPVTRTVPAGNTATATPADKAAYTATTVYNKANRVIKTGAPNPANPAETLWTVTGYDTAGRPKTTTDPLGRATTVAYDALNRIVAVTDPLGGITRTGYNKNSQPVTRTTPTGAVTTIAYNVVGQPTSVTDPLGNTTTYAYDAAGRVTGVTDPRGNVAGATPSQYTTTYTYDDNANVLTVTNPLGQVVATNTWDAGDRRLTVKNGKNQTTTWVYDNDDNPLSVKAPDTGITAYTYNANDWLTTVKAPTLGVTTYTYDAAGRVLTVADPANRTTTYTYNPNGQPATATKPSGKKATYGYDTLGRLTGVDYSDTTPDVTYAYDKASQPIGMTDGAGSVAYGYNTNGWPTTITRTPTTGAVQAWAYGYDADGNITTRTRPDASVQTATLNTAGQPTTVTTPQGNVTFTYDPAGAVTAVGYPNGVTENRTIDRAGWMTGLTVKKGTATLTAQTITRDAMGNPTRTDLTRGTTSESRSYLYDTNERITGVCYTATCTATAAAQAWTYDKNGNLLTQRDGNSTSGVTTTYTVDTSNRVTTRKIGTAAATSFTYDADGNLTTDGTRAWTYDAAGRTLTAKTTPTGNVTTYGYDGSGLRLNATTAGTGATASYQYDSLNPYPLLTGITTDADGSGPTSPSITSLRWDDNGGSLGQTVDGVQGWFGHDPIGSITDVVTSTGVIGRSYDYTPYGQTRAPPGAPASPTGPQAALGYTSAPTNPDSTIYLQARNYDPTSGRFTALDPIGQTGSAGPYGVYGTPYGYVAGRPGVFTDPTGLYWGEDQVNDFLQEVSYQQQAAADGGGYVASYSDSLAQVTPEQAVTTFAGYTDGLTFGGSRVLRHGVENIIGSGSTVNECSAEYGGGQFVGTTTLVVTSAGITSIGYAPADALLQRGVSALSERGSQFTQWARVAMADERGATGPFSRLPHGENPNLFEPGRFAKDSIAARGKGTNFTSQERAEINRIGNETGCHSCGATNSGRRSGNWTPDHQPVSKTVPDGTPQRLYPHCVYCSNTQGGLSRWKLPEE